VLLTLILYEIAGGLHAPNGLVTEKGLAVPTEEADQIPHRMPWRGEKFISHAGNPTTITHSSGIQFGCYTD
jgi:hypothetical protein